MKSAGTVITGRLSIFMLLVVLTFQTIMISGCSTTNPKRPNKPSAPRENPFRIERTPSEAVYVSELNVVQDGDEMLIYGKGKHTANNCYDTAK